MKSYKNAVHSTLLALSVILVAVLFTRTLNQSSAIHASGAQPTTKQSRVTKSNRNQSGTVIDFTNNFDQAVNNSGFVVVDFFAEWCPTCKSVEETFMHVAQSQDFMNKVTFGKLDIDKARIVASYFHIGAIPTFICFKNGKPIGDSIVGGLDETKLTALINERFGF